MYNFGMFEQFMDDGYIPERHNSDIQVGWIQPESYQIFSF